MATNKLKAKQIELAKPGEKPYKLTDGDGMYLLVDTKGGRYWRLDYRFAEKRKTLALGPFPDVSLEEARKAREAACPGKSAAESPTRETYRPHTASSTPGSIQRFRGRSCRMRWHLQKPLTEATS